MLPVFGPEAKLQPLWVDDAAEAVADALADPAQHGGKTYEIAGPEPLTMGALNRMIAAAQQRSPLFLDMPDVASALFAAAAADADEPRPVEAAQGRRHCRQARYPGLKQLGVSPKPLGLFLDKLDGALPQAWPLRGRSRPPKRPKPN